LPLLSTRRAFRRGHCSPVSRYWFGWQVQPNPGPAHHLYPVELPAAAISAVRTVRALDLAAGRDLASARWQTHGRRVKNLSEIFGAITYQSFDVYDFDLLHPIALHTRWCPCAWGAHVRAQAHALILVSNRCLDSQTARAIYFQTSRHAASALPW